MTKDIALEITDEMVEKVAKSQLSSTAEYVILELKRQRDSAIKKTSNGHAIYEAMLERIDEIMYDKENRDEYFALFCAVEAYENIIYPIPNKKAIARRKGNDEYLNRDRGSYRRIVFSSKWYTKNPWSFVTKPMPYIGSASFRGIHMKTFGPIAIITLRIK